MGRKKSREIVLKGIPVSPGIALGKAVFIKQDIMKPERLIVSPDDIDNEIDRLEKAVEITREDISKTRSRASKNMGEIVSRIFDAHMMILEDDVFFNEVKNKIRNERFAADFALFHEMSKTYNSLLSKQQEYFRERAEDIRDVGIRLLSNIYGKSNGTIIHGDEPVIIIARMLTPSEVVQMNRSLILGVMTDIGGMTSHIAILTRALEAPAVVGLKKVSMYHDRVNMAVVNGNSGKVVLNPSEKSVEEYIDKRRRYIEFYDRLENIKDLPCETIDGHRISLEANIELPHEVEAVKSHGAEGIGLFRTEYLYLLRNEFPDEDEQYREYRKIVEAMKDKPVTIRTFDLGGDKTTEGLEIGREANPFMGLRAIRIALAEPELLKKQMRAILRASAHGKVKMMFPLVTGISEYRKIKRIISQVKRELKQNNINFDEDIEIGVMIEVPSAVIMAPELAREVDFFSIGTNDLIQFTLAVDRGNAMVAHMFKNLHPAILRMIKMTVEAGHKRGIEVSMCGEMAGDPLATLILLGLGIDRLSVSPIVLPEIKKIVRSTIFADAKEFADRVIKMKTHDEIRKASMELMKRKFADLPIWFTNQGNH
ncbi:phosphoenolpyruvate--protein phosphotransferase [bacterium]|nr:phosphoenolpyruvate--protein phosphotransferase [FCB group bacterium]MBL7191061.1 phosphoenolpyruvate--protein phosphotransferase [bacterium]